MSWMSLARERPARGTLPGAFRPLVLGLALPALSLVSWQAICLARLLPPYVLPSPAAVLERFGMELAGETFSRLRRGVSDDESHALLAILGRSRASAPRSAQTLPDGYPSTGVKRPIRDAFVDRVEVSRKKARSENKPAAQISSESLKDG
jgi:hypothetical protein